MHVKLTYNNNLLISVFPFILTHLQLFSTVSMLASDQGKRAGSRVRARMHACMPLYCTLHGEFAKLGSAFLSAALQGDNTPRLPLPRRLTRGVSVCVCVWRVCVHIQAVNKWTYCACCWRKWSIGKVGACEIGDHYKWIARVRWALEQPSILPFRS